MGFQVHGRCAILCPVPPANRSTASLSSPSARARPHERRLPISRARAMPLRAKSESWSNDPLLAEISQSTAVDLDEGVAIELAEAVADFFKTPAACEPARIQPL
jgi:hypothetical protein